MNSVWHFYEPHSGHFTGCKFCGPAYALEANTPAGLKAYEGEIDHLSQRLGENGALIDWQPPQPSSDHEWNAEMRRWVLTAAAADRHRRRIEALARIEQLERSQHRAIREAALGQAGAGDRLKAIDQEIAQLRADL